MAKHIMKFKKNTIIALAILTVVILPSSVSYAQLGGLLGGLLQAAGERWIDNTSSLPSNQDKENARTILNALSNEINANQNAANATRDAYNGNYTGAVIQGAQTILNATGNYQYDTYLNSANQINNANRQYNQDIQNGMDRNAALDKRNTAISYSAAESAIELQDKIARERAEKARLQREAERQSWENNNYYSKPSYIETTNTRTATSNVKVETQNVPEASWKILQDYAAGMDKSARLSENVYKNRDYNNNVHTLSSNGSVKFLTDEGEAIYLYVLDHSNGGTYMSYYNHDNKERRLSCNWVTLKVKYSGDDNVQTITDVCSFVMPANRANSLEWSDIFSKISKTKPIENIEISFVETQIK